MKKILTLILFLSTLTAEQTHTLSVRGSATLQVPPDTLVVTLGVTTEAKSASDALKENNSRMNGIMEGLKKLGLKPSELATAQFTISPQYTPPPKQRPANWDPKIESFRVSNLITAKSHDTSLAGKIIDTATKNGANTINSVDYTLSNPRRYRVEAIETATKNALQDAKTLADAAGQSIDSVLSLTLDKDTSFTPYPKARMQFASLSDSTTLSPSEVEVLAEVDALFELSSK